MMTVWKASPTVILLMAALVIIGVAIVVATGPLAPRVEVTRVGDPPPSTTAIPQATTTSVALSPTVPPPSPTPYPTEVVIVLPTLVVDETFVPIILTPDPTVQAKSQLDRYLIEKLYFEPATLVAQGTNTTPVPSGGYTDVALLTYEVREITLPEAKTWDAWVPGPQGGLEVRPVTFTQAWRVTVKGTGFFVGGSDWLMYADDQVIGRCGFASGGLTTIIYDRSLLTEGARLGVSFGGSSLIYLPEVLHLPPGP
jgi:hypothetical protein